MNKKINKKTEEKTKEKSKGKIKIKRKRTCLIFKNIAGIFLITCNTILYCVLYKKVMNISLIYYIINMLYVFVNVYIGMKDIKYKIITNKSNLLLFTLGLIIYVYENLIINKISFINLVDKIILKFVIIAMVFLLLIFIRKILSNNIGGGDIKMLTALMIRFDLTEMLSIITISVVTSFIYSMYLLFIKHKSKNYKFSFGEFISLGVIIVSLTY